MEPAASLHADGEYLNFVTIHIDRIENPEPIVRAEAQLPIRLKIHFSKQGFAIGCFYVWFIHKLLYDCLPNQRMVLPFDRIQMSPNLCVINQFKKGSGDPINKIIF